MGKSRVVDIDKGWNRIVQQLEVLNDLDVFIGIHSDAPSTDETGKLTAAAIGAIHEFGSKDGRIPQRQWLRAGIDHFSREIGEKYAELFKDITAGRGFDAKRALNRLGLFGVAKVREYIRKVGQDVWPDITDATKIAKDSTKILIDTGQLIQGITHTVRVASVSQITASSIAAGIKRPESREKKPAKKRIKRSLKTIRSERRKSASENKSARKKATKVRRKVAKKRRTQAKKSRQFMGKLRKEQKNIERKVAKKAQKKARKSALTVQKRATRKRNTTKRRESKKATSKRRRIAKTARNKIARSIKRDKAKVKKIRNLAKIRSFTGARKK